jgi:methyltransferase-like protein 6
VFCCDFSPRAVNLVRTHPEYRAERIVPFECDITSQSTRIGTGNERVEAATMLFVLSAIHPDKMHAALRHTAESLDPEVGRLYFRDYALYDSAQLRFAKGHKLGDSFYVRQDGTQAYYFSLDVMQSLCDAVGLRVIDMRYVHSRTENRKEEISLDRVFIQGVFAVDQTHTEWCRDTVGHQLPALATTVGELAESPRGQDGGEDTVAAFAGSDEASVGPPE